MIIPIWRFWRFTPIAFMAGLVWNFFEIIQVPCPFASTIFGLAIGRKGRKVEKS